MIMRMPGLCCLHVLVLPLLGQGLGPAAPVQAVQAAPGRLPALSSPAPGVVSLRFAPPVLLGGAPWQSKSARTALSANESFVDTFFALSDTHLFGQYNYCAPPHKKQNKQQQQTNPARMHARHATCRQ